MKSSQTDELTFLVLYVIYLMLVNHKHASYLKLSPGMRCNAILVALEVDQLQRELYLTTHVEGQREYFKTYF